MNKNIFLGIGVILVALVVAVSTVSFSGKDEAPTPSDAPTGVTQVAPGEFPEGALIGSTYEKYVSGTMGAGVNQVSYRNTSGRTQYVDLAIARTTGTASTTQRITASTSTSATVDNFGTNFANSLLNFTLATSSVATTTNSMQGSGATNGIGVVALADGEYLNFALRQTFQQGNCSGSVCETATSTNRGFNVEVLARILQIK